MRHTTNAVLRKLVLTAGLFSASVTVTAQNWPQFRGAGAAGVADGQPTAVSWDGVRGTNVRWKTPIPGLSHASPVVWGNRVFVITAISEEPAPLYKAKDRGIGLARDDFKHAWKIYALDKRTGKILWERTAHEGMPRARRHVKATQANSTPVTDGRVVVALMGSEGLYAYDFAGKLLWKQDLGVLNPGLWDDKQSSWGHGSSPVIHGGRVIVQADGHAQSFIAAYDLKTGKQAWRVERGEITSWSTPTLYEVKGRTELVANGGRYIRGYDPSTGKELWRFSDNDTQVKQQAPLFAHGLVYVAGGYPPGRGMYAFRPGAAGDISLKPNEPTNAHLAWKTDKGSPYTTTPLVYGDILYGVADGGVLSAFEAKTGKLIYQERLPTSFSASPVAADGKLYLPSEDGDVLVVRAGPKFELLSKNPMGEPLMATPAVSDGTLLVRSQRHVFAVCECGPAGKPAGGR
ncbi:MAG: PQQ-binding-like beta-propeller repeat protein [Acidobacteria bacterium]|nr:PQQ-binding-like beta-propeller repeat protein [Acidobacteriota bacterium]